MAGCLLSQQSSASHPPSHPPICQPSSQLHEEKWIHWRSGLAAACSVSQLISLHVAVIRSIPRRTLRTLNTLKTVKLKLTLNNFKHFQNLKKLKKRDGRDLAWGWLAACSVSNLPPAIHPAIRPSASQLHEAKWTGWRSGLADGWLLAQSTVIRQPSTQPSAHPPAIQPATWREMNWLAIWLGGCLLSQSSHFPSCSCSSFHFPKNLNTLL